MAARTVGATRQEAQGEHEQEPLIHKASAKGDVESQLVQAPGSAKSRDRPGSGGERSKGWAMFAVLLYGTMSITITFVNKAVFFVWHFNFPVTITLLQVLMSLVLFAALHLQGTIPLPALSRRTLILAIPLAAFWCLNVLSGIFTLEYMSIPMFSTLRRLTTLIVLVGEHVLLHKYASRAVWLSVILMTVGALIAGAGDLDYNPMGYFCVAVNNVCTAGYLLQIQVTKSRLGVNNFQLLFLMNLCSFPFLVTVAYLCDLKDVLQYEDRLNPSFLVVLFCSCVQAFVLNYATFLCTTLNSGVTTSITGQMSKLVTMTVGLFVFVNTAYTPIQLFGLFIGLVSSMWYTYIKVISSSSKE